MKDKKTLDDLGVHPFIQRCFDDARRVSLDLEDSKPFRVEPFWKRDPYEDEYYQLTVGAAAATLLNACQQLTGSILYLSAFTPSVWMKKLGVSRQRHIQFCIESFIVRAQSIYDKLLVLVDAVFHLGNANESINHNSIVTNVHIKMAGVSDKLKAMNKVRHKYLYVRNEVIHHTNFKEGDLRRLQGLSLLRDGRRDDGFKLLLKELTREYVKKKVSEFNIHVAELFGHVYKILSDMDTMYQEKKKAFSSNQAMQPTGKAGG